MLNLQLVEALSRTIDLSRFPTLAYPAGRHLMLTGDPVTRLPLVLSGTVDAVVHQMTDDGNAVVPVCWGEGELALTSYLFSKETAGADLIALDDCEFKWIPVDEVERAMVGDAELLVLVVRFLAKRLREVQARERAWLERGVHERVLATMVRIAWSMPATMDGRVVVSATHETLAARCGVSRSRLSRELKQMEDAGLVQLGRGSVQIIDRTRFTSMLRASASR